MFRAGGGCAFFALFYLRAFVVREVFRGFCATRFYLCVLRADFFSAFPRASLFGFSFEFVITICYGALYFAGFWFPRLLYPCRDIC